MLFSIQITSCNNGVFCFFQFIPRTLSHEQCDQMLEEKQPYSPKVAQKVARRSFYGTDYLNEHKKFPNVWATFVKRFFAQTFKNSPIWSHWSRVSPSNNGPLYLFNVIITQRLAEQLSSHKHAPKATLVGGSIPS